MVHRPQTLQKAGIPLQLLLGFLFMVTGALVIAKKVGKDYLPFIPEDVLVYIIAVGSVMGGAYMIFMKFYRHRIYI